LPRCCLAAASLSRAPGSGATAAARAFAVGCGDASTAAGARPALTSRRGDGRTGIWRREWAGAAGPCLAVRSFASQGGGSGSSQSSSGPQNKPPDGEGEGLHGLGPNAGELPKGADNVQFTWKSAIFTTFVCGGVLWYYEYLIRRKQEEGRAVTKQEYIGKPKLGGPFELLDRQGKPVTEKDFLGQYLLIYFGFTFCPDICPQEMEKQTRAVELIDQAIGPVVTPVFISVDPTRDDPPQVDDYCKEFHPRIVGLTGTPEQVKAVSRAYRVYFNEGIKNSEKDYLIDHSIIHYFVGKNGKFVEFFGKNMTAVEIAASMKKTILEDQEKARQRKARRGVESADGEEE